MRIKIDPYRISLVIIFTVVWILSAIHPKFPHDWLLENYLVFFFLPIIFVSGYFFRLSDLSYTLITLFMCLHVIGSHYTYSEVPFGYTLQNWLGASRNMYDRLVHFCFGLLLAYPIREVFIRLARVKGFWSYYLPFDVTLSFSAIYELIEWAAAANIDSSAGIAFLGSQGDIWDAQKDMAIAGLGALIAMFVIAFIRWMFDKNFWKEIRDSFKLRKNDRPLGEEKLREWINESEH